MDLIFELEVYKKEYRDLLKILPILNDCNICMKFKCQLWQTYNYRCKNCREEKCRNCDVYIRTRDTLLENPNLKAANYVFNFLIDYFNSNDFTRQFFKLDISEQLITENIFKESNKNIQKTNKSYVNYNN